MTFQPMTHTDSPVPQMADDTEACWQAVIARDRGMNGRFVFAVTSMGVYCRPSCPARRPARTNVRFFVDGAAARTAGFRPCLRCRPDDVQREAVAVARVLAAIGAAVAAGEGVPPLTELAAQTGYSPDHFRRIFARATGLSPAACARAMRDERVCAALSAGGRVTDAIYEAGFAAPSRFYARTAERLGMAPSAWSRGGAGVSIRWAVVETTLGQMLVAASEKGICRLAFGEGRDELARRFPKAELRQGGPDFAMLLGEVIRAVEAPGAGHELPLDVRGTVFQEAVWRALRQIPAGETRSYAEIATAIGRPGAVRAAGSANGANPVAVLVPCHRVVRADGSLGGYAWGEEIKRELLAREKGQTKL